MTQYIKSTLSGSTNGKQIKVAATGTPGTLIHTAVSGTTDYDEIWLWAVNSSASSVALTIEWGGVANPDDRITINIPANAGLQIVVPGLILNNSNVVRAFAGSANVVMISGFVNKITN